ncbi:DUF92 domain-containing protein [Halomarina ordinaria]|uniref:DUF92 domain-containing protein n=1 Tax=Halomarina ordinaria TaxID=3033939 RepID=A0ABD5U717_9EURY|nr:DUF92 domain-containing protein [Halomarina sp. PSRA2]
MDSTVRRAGAFALVGALSLAVPALAGRLDPPVATVTAVLPFLLVAVAALTASKGGRLFDLFARPGDREEGRLYGLAGFALAAAGLALLTAVGLPTAVVVATLLLVVVGAFAEAGVRGLWGDPFYAVAAFVAVGFGAGVLGQLAAAALDVASRFVPPEALFLAATGALLAALLRSMLFERDDPLVLLTVALVLWLFDDLALALTPQQVVVGLAVTVALGYLSYALETASITGMLAGVFLAFLTVMLGGFGWLAVLVSFFGIGGLSTKFRYEQKRERGLAEGNDGARGSGNVLANSAVALAAVLGAATSSVIGLPESVFFFAFAGAVAAAMGDTLSSEVGGLYGPPRLITTLERVPPGTDGGVTWQGVVAGLAGTAVVAGIAALFFDLGVVAALVVVVAGFVGMTADSVLGATVEGGVVGNQGVNFLATLVAAVVAGACALGLPAVAL